MLPNKNLMGPRINLDFNSSINNINHFNLPKVFMKDVLLTRGSRILRVITNRLLIISLEYLNNSGELTARGAFAVNSGESRLSSNTAELAEPKNPFPESATISKRSNASSEEEISPSSPASSSEYCAVTFIVFSIKLPYIGGNLESKISKTSSGGIRFCNSSLTASFISKCLLAILAFASAIALLFLVCGARGVFFSPAGTL
ncbi:MAG: hypothetical protein KJ926_07155, partial [Candidatus Omnitrophica bacterium]|nr:hypothetical protein [Candidatus Omnitrophota bacterium]